MRLQILSDLHLERYPDYRPRAAGDAEVLVLAGDIGSYQAGSLLAEPDWGLSRFSPKAGGPWRQVLFVPGNHEYDGLPLQATRTRLREMCSALGITWLEQEAVVLDGVRFAGTTLWADFDALADPGEGDTPTGLRLRDKAFRAADFYLRKNTARMDGDLPLLAEPMREVALGCQRWLRETLSTPFDGPTVVVTHFAPSLRSADPRYGVTPGTAGFCNALDHLLPLADLWIHGHLHCPQDYVVEGVRNGKPHRCRVVANPRGYAHKGEQAAFREALCVDVPRDRLNATRL